MFSELQIIIIIIYSLSINFIKTAIMTVEELQRLLEGVPDKTMEVLVIDEKRPGFTPTGNVYVHEAVYTGGGHYKLVGDQGEPEKVLIIQ